MDTCGMEVHSCKLVLGAWFLTPIVVFPALGLSSEPEPVPLLPTPVCTPLLMCTAAAPAPQLGVTYVSWWARVVP